MEVKSGKHTRAWSLANLMENYQSVRKIIKLEKEESVWRNDSGAEHYPLFMGMWV